MKIKLLNVFLLTLLVNYSASSANPVGLNGVLLEKKDSVAVSFIVGGHLYGSGNQSGYPASTLIANIDSINGSNIDFMVSLGDLFSNLKTDLKTYKYGLLDKLKVPLFNAVGNHDVFDPELYQKEFGKTFFTFTKSNSCFIFLDTEIDKGNISGEQLDLVKESFGKAAQKSLKNIFLFSHRPIWISQFPEIDEIFNGADKAMLSTYESTIAPLLKQSNAKIFWISGSMGSNAKESFFIKKEGNANYLLTAIRDRKEDGLLKVEVDDSGGVHFKTISLAGKNLKEIENYDTAYWRSSKGKVEFSWPVIKFHIYRTVMHKFFWIGGMTCIITFLLLKRIIFSIK